MAAEDRLDAGEVRRPLVIQFPPEGANREHHVVGLCEERLGVRDPHVPEAPWARALYLYGPRHGFPPLGDVLGVAAPEFFDGALAVSRQECAQVADVLFEGGCLPLQLLLQLALRGRAESGRRTSQLLREPDRRLGPDAMPFRVRMVCRRRARCQGVVAEDRCLEPFPALRRFPPARSVPAGDGCRRPTTRRQGVMRRMEVFEHLVHCGRGHGPVGLLLCGAQPGRQAGLILRAVTNAHRQHWTGAASASYGRRRPSVWL